MRWWLGGRLTKRLKLTGAAILVLRASTLSQPGALFVVAALPSVGGPERPDVAVVQTSPRLGAIRPHLRAGASYGEVVKEVGQEDVNFGDAVLRPVYFLDGKHRGMWLELAFDGDRLRSARIYDPEMRKVIEQVRVAPAR